MTDQTNQTDNIKRVSTDTSPDGVYSGLRHQALSVSRTETEIAEPPADAPVWGILMETGYEGTTVTLFALADGTTSLYFSNGGGMIGGHAHETVRNANARLIHEANRDLKLFTPCDAFPIPATGRTIFYLLTDTELSFVFVVSRKREYHGTSPWHFSTLAQKPVRSRKL